MGGGGGGGQVDGTGEQVGGTGEWDGGGICKWKSLYSVYLTLLLVHAETLENVKN